MLLVSSVLVAYTVSLPGLMIDNTEDITNVIREENKIKHLRIGKEETKCFVIHKNILYLWLSMDKLLK